MDGKKLAFVARPPSPEGVASHKGEKEIGGEEANPSPFVAASLAPVPSPKAKKGEGAREAATTGEKGTKLWVRANTKLS